MTSETLQQFRATETPGLVSGNRVIINVDEYSRNSQRVEILKGFLEEMYKRGEEETCQPALETLIKVLRNIKDNHNLDILVRKEKKTEIVPMPICGKNAIIGTYLDGQGCLTYCNQGKVTAEIYEVTINVRKKIFT